MKWFKRTWLSIIRRPFKTFLLFLVVFAMATLLAGSLSIVQTCGTIKDSLKKSIAPKVVLDYENYYEVNGAHFFRELNLEQFNKYLNVVNKMGEDENVIENEQSYALESVYATHKDLGIDDSDKRIYFSIISTNVIQTADMASGSIKLNSVQNNRFFTEEELDSDEILIVTQQNLAFINDDPFAPTRTGLCDIGNEVTLTLPSPDGYYDQESGLMRYDKEYKFKAKVIGVIDNKIVNNFEYFTRVYISDKAFMKLVKDANNYYKDNDFNTELAPRIYSTTFTMDSIDSTKVFNENVKDLRAQLPEGVEWDSTSDLYERNVGPVETLNAVAKVILIASIIATVLILGLVVIFLIGDRKQEMGIYVSLGEKTKRIISQVVCEIVLVSILSVSFASVSGLFLGNKLSDYMLEIQRYVQRQQKMGALAHLPVIYKPIEGGLTMNTRDEVIDNFEVQADAEYFVTLYVISGLSVVVSCMVPVGYLMSLKPKEIML